MATISFGQTGNQETGATLKRALRVCEDEPLRNEFGDKPRYPFDCLFLMAGLKYEQILERTARFAPNMKLNLDVSVVPQEDSERSTNGSRWGLDFNPVSRVYRICGLLFSRPSTRFRHCKSQRFIQQPYSVLLADHCAPAPGCQRHIQSAGATPKPHSNSKHLVTTLLQGILIEINHFVSDAILPI
jgi:hypothetical protein